MYLFRFTIIAVFLVVISGCQQEQSAEQPVSAHPPSVAATDSKAAPEVTQQPLATVDEKITLVEEQAAVEKRVQVATEETVAEAQPKPVEATVTEKPVTPPAETAPVAVEKAIVEKAVVTAVGDAGKGAKVSRKCSACHTFDKGAKNKTGPNLFGIIGAKKGAVAGFRYGDYLKAENSAGAVWDADSMRAWLENSKEVAKVAGSSTKMASQRITGSKADDLIAYLKTLK